MHTLDLRSGASFLSEALGRLLALPHHWRRRRRMLTLLDLDDALLDDIGVTRDEVRVAAGMPLSANAAVELNRMGLERRRSRV